MLLGSALLVVGTLAALELIPALGVITSLTRLAHRARRATQLLLRTGVSEWAKERALRLASASLLRASLTSGGLLLLVAAPILFLLMLNAVLPLGVREALIDGPSRIAIFLISSAYLLMRRQQRKTASAAGERLLQRVALGSRAVLETSFSIERRLHPPLPNERIGGAPIFIVGLARAGTTIVTRLLHDTGLFASPTYRDLPFPLAPNGWARIGQRMKREVARVERGHGDGLEHDLDSPEALEELFWLCHEGERYRGRDGLRPVNPEARSIAAFRDYVRLVRRRYGRDRYLSKNNSNILRLPALVEAFDDAILIHPFRDPIEQSASLLGQHIRACALAREDPFRRHFMHWLGHHEFGADHRPFLLTSEEHGDDPSRIDYWLRRWIEAYAFLIGQPEAIRSRQIFVDYDGLCAAPEAGSRRLATGIGIAVGLEWASLRKQPVRHAGCNASKMLVAQAYAVHDELIARSQLRPASNTLRLIA
ncbi:sulfotransferase [Flavisphingomonas formosensis]|uniref:sulfotransferase n=1 Tax=Flavisphingomonas formosensis TaxID=861534 RepID=UPI0012FBC947|nr:sulfotransferase [Sphingomonas formosensis]